MNKDTACTAEAPFEESFSLQQFLFSKRQDAFKLE